MKFLKRIFYPSTENSTDINRVIVLLWSLISIGLLSLLFPALVRINEGNWTGAFTIVGSGLFLAGASTLAGSILGFLFGVPKKQPDNSFRANSEDSKSGIEKYQPNTNLEQISDWLTKIIVGVGLIEIRNVIAFFKEVGKFCGPAFGSSPSGEIIATSITIHYILIGFIQGFLLAYLWLPKAFERATKPDKDKNAQP